MARKFTKQERQHVQQALITYGRQLFRTYGFQKTSISDITKEVGIAQGTFYRFFTSKEALYFTVLEQEEAEIRQQILRLSLNTNTKNNPQARLKEIFHNMLALMEKNPLLRELYFGNGPTFVQHLPSATLTEHFVKDTEAITSLIQTWHAEGIIIEEDPAIVAGILRSLILLTFQQQEIGETVYSKTMERIINFIVAGLVKEADDSCRQLRQSD